LKESAGDLTFKLGIVHIGVSKGNDQFVMYQKSTITKLHQRHQAMIEKDNKRTIEVYAVVIRLT